MEKNKVALITGSTSGIGKAIAIQLAKLNYSLIINGARTTQLSEEYNNSLKEIYNDALKNRIIYIQADISKKSERITLVEKVKTRFGRIDVLINNAGIAPPERKDILNASESSFEKVLKVNVQGPYFLTQLVANWMLKLREEIINYNPYIINISSISSFTSSPSRGEYCISKAAMTMMTKLYADRLSEFNIPVYEIQPGIIKTRMTSSVKEKYDHLINEGLTPIKRWGLPEDIAKTVKAIVSGLLPYSTGDIIHIDGGFHLKRL
ncbi:MAG: 3-ketoacyl-ACP reductase [Candidatus Lokiarchaeota archaeon]|nr:3-ketoacyl-ACP reductase [Candidatus Lokiarchaeota archaeon]MBD3201700.1 3-ketoacyl-ACP reductase [Candidatus Lokiarchaeota archaeon]